MRVQIFGQQQREQQWLVVAAMIVADFHVPFDGDWGPRVWRRHATRGWRAGASASTRWVAMGSIAIVCRPKKIEHTSCLDATCNASLPRAFSNALVRQ